MEDIDITLSKIIRDITFSKLESLTEMKDGHLLLDILNHIDPVQFPMLVDSISWSQFKTRLEAFLTDKGLKNQILDFDEISISHGTLEYLISAVIQILAVFAVFNETEWNQIMDQFDIAHKNSILQILNPMINDIIEELNNKPKNNDFKVILLKLERKENELVEMRQTLYTKDEALLEKNKEIEKLTADNKSLSNEIEELNKLKGETIKQIEDYYSDRNDKSGDEDLAKRLQRMINEKDELADKLFRLQLLSTDKDNEIEKLILIKNAYEDKRMEMESFTEQLQYFRTLSEKLKTDVEVKDSKIKALEVSEEKISKFKDKVKKQAALISDFKSEKLEKDNKIQTLEKKLIAADEKVDIIRRSSNSALYEPHKDFLSESTQLARLEDENERLMQKINKLCKKLDDAEIDKTDMSALEQENQLLKGKIKSLSILNITSPERQSMSKNKLTRSQLSTRLTFPPIEEESHDNTFGFTSSIHDLHSDYSIAEKPYQNEEDIDIIYTVCMEFLQKEIMKTRMLIPTRDERTRDIFKQFTMRNFIRSYD